METLLQNHPIIMSSVFFASIFLLATYMGFKFAQRVWRLLVGITGWGVSMASTFICYIIATFISYGLSGFLLLVVAHAFLGVDPTNVIFASGYGALYWGPIALGSFVTGVTLLWLQALREYRVTALVKTVSV